MCRTDSVRPPSSSMSFSFHFVLFLSLLTNPPTTPQPPTPASRRAVDDRAVCCCFIWSKWDGCSSKLEEAQRNPKAWYQTSDLALRHRGGRRSGDSRVRRPNRPQTSLRVSPPHPLLLQNKPEYMFTVAEIRAGVQYDAQGKPSSLTKNHTVSLRGSNELFMCL